MTTTKTEEAKTLPPENTKDMAQVKAAEDKGKDYGDWEYKPWLGRDHWVHKVTKESTFSLKDVR